MAETEHAELKFVLYARVDDEVHERLAHADTQFIRSFPIHTAKTVEFQVESGNVN